MSIHFYAEDVLLPNLNFEAIKKGLKRELRLSKMRLGVINYIFCSDPYLLEINNQFLKHDFFTDVVTFDYSDDLVVSGDVYISTDRVLDNSAIFGQIYDIELIRVISHGLLHLLKFGDKEEEEIILMRKKETDLIDRICSFGDSK
jgi:rRNA maturation RNase YbeY